MGSGRPPGNSLKIETQTENGPLTATFRDMGATPSAVRWGSRTDLAYPN